jgi:methylase of polypeptide subunit release factors
VRDYARRMEILSQNIYGVDKDEQAVAVAKLNLSLKALHTRDRLPMLQNIRVGDSLISGTPDELSAAFGKNWQDIKPFNWETEFSQVMRVGGFDVVVGNPPYIRAERMPRDERDYYTDSKHFEVAGGRFDIHILFVERALKLLKP